MSISNVIMHASARSKTVLRRAGPHVHQLPDSCPSLVSSVDLVWTVSTWAVQSIKTEPPVEVLFLEILDICMWFGLLQVSSW